MAKRILKEVEDVLNSDPIEKEEPIKAEEPKKVEKKETKPSKDGGLRIV